MYEAFFGLTQEPFSIAPDPRFLYMSPKHDQALALLTYGLARGASFVLLTGEIGAGKTTVWRRFLEQLPSNFDVANVVNPKLDVTTLLARVCDDLGVERPEAAGPVDLIDALHGHLLLAHAQGRRTLIVIDEAQALSLEVLEQLRLLTNLDSSGRKLQVMLIGQPELRELLALPALEPLAQRVVARYHLQALSEAETAGYIVHRLQVAGLQGAVPFDGESIGLIHRLCRGVPRRINTVCDRALAAAAAAGVRRVDRRIVENAVAEVYGRPAGAPPRPGAEGADRADTATGRPAVNAWALAGVAGIALAAGVLLAPRLAGTAEAPGALASLLPGMKTAAVAPAPAPVPASTPTLDPAPVSARALPAPVTLPPAPVAAPAPVAVAVAAPVPALAAPVATPTPGLESLFTPATASEAAAWRALALRWGSSLAPGEPCVAAAAQALQCLRSRGGMAAIRLYDRPGILRLDDELGRSAHVLLVGLSGDSATLDIGGAERQLPLLALARLWRGEFATYWRAPPGWRDGEPASTAWVAQRLAAIDGQAPASGEALRARLVAFQLAQGLVPDGVAGPLTLMQLGRAGRADGGDEPRLQARPGVAQAPS